MQKEVKITEHVLVKCHSLLKGYKTLLEEALKTQEDMECARLLIDEIQDAEEMRHFLLRRKHESA